MRLGTGTVIAPFWHPIKLAGEAAMTDIITGGRLDIGIARGAYNFEYQRLSPGLDAWAPGQRMREMVPAIKGLWAGDYAHDGEFWSFPATTSAPKPLQQPHPPIWVAARDPDSRTISPSPTAATCRYAARRRRRGDREPDAALQRRLRDHPQIPRPKIMLLLHAFVGSDEADIARPPWISVYYNYFGAWFKNERPIRRADRAADRGRTRHGISARR